MCWEENLIYSGESNIYFLVCLPVIILCYYETLITGYKMSSGLLVFVSQDINFSDTFYIEITSLKYHGELFDLVKMFDVHNIFDFVLICLFWDIIILTYSVSHFFLR